MKHMYKKSPQQFAHALVEDYHGIVGLCEMPPGKYSQEGALACSVLADQETPVT